MAVEVVVGLVLVAGVADDVDAATRNGNGPLSQPDQLKTTTTKSTEK